MISIVTDSSICLSKSESVQRCVNIVPLTYSVNGVLFHELYNDTNGRFEELLKGAKKCTTSQPSPAAFLSTFEELTRHGGEVLCLVISSRLSGTYSSALHAAREAGGKIRIVDTRTTLGGMRILAERARELIDEGADLETVASVLEKERDNVCVAFSVDSMDALRKSGRIGFVRQSVGAILNLKPMLLCENGTVVSKGSSKGRAEQIKMLCAQVPQNAKKLVVHYLGKSDVSSLISALCEKLPQVPITVSYANPVIAVNIGIPALGVAWTT